MLQRAPVPRAAIRLTVALLGSWLLIGASVAEGASRLAPVGRLRAESVGVSRIALAWRDRSRGERRFEVVARADGERAVRARAPRNAERAVVRRLRPGTLYSYSVRPCGRSRCGKRRSGGPAATLLAPFDGPHPDPRCAIFPPGDEFNRPVAGAPLDPRSEQIIDQILADGGDGLHPDFGSNPRYGIPYAVVGADQPGVPIRFTAFGDESDPGPYPIPPGAPVEGGRGGDGDRHVLVVRRPASPGGSCELFELYRSFERNGSPRNGWNADSGAVFDLGAPLAGQRPAGWTSADAAGLPIYPGLVTYEEVASGEIDHAIRITFERTRSGYIPPATHSASDSCDARRPPMGMRLRLGATYDISGIGGDAGVIARALQRYGAIVADNGSNFFISGSTDRRWNDSNLNQLKAIPGSAFEVVAPAGAEVSDC